MKEEKHWKKIEERKKKGVGCKEEGKGVELVEGKSKGKESFK